MKLLTLDNGLRIIIRKNDKLHSAILGVWVASGPRYETEETNGISHFIEHMVFKSSENRTAFEIAQGFDEIGAQTNAYTTKEYTFYYTHALDYQIMQAADILFDMIKNPKFDPKDIETECGVVIEEITMCEDDPSDVCYELNEREIFSGTTMALDILGTRKSVSSFTHDTFVDYMKTNYVPERMVVGISGNFDEDAILEKINEYFGKDENTSNPLVSYELDFNNKINLQKGEFEQTHIQMCFKGVPIRHEDLAALRIATFILGTGSSSRLNQRIREQLGLVYSIDTWLGRYLGGGYISVNMSVSPKSEEMAITESLKIIKNFALDITDREVNVAKEKLISSLIMSREHPQSKFSTMGTSQLLFGSFIEDEEIITGIKEITPEMVKDVALKYLDLEKMSFTAVGKVKNKKHYEKIIKSV